MEHKAPVFPTVLHKDVATVVHDYFSKLDVTDTILVVNSCARGHATAESDIDIAVLAKENITNAEILLANNKWIEYSSAHPLILQYKISSRFRHLHLDIINGNYVPVVIEPGEPVDFFEVEIGNQICYAVPIGGYGNYYEKLQLKWLPYYEEQLRLNRLKDVVNSCRYDLDHIPFYLKRGLYFHSLYTLHKAFEEYLQALFIANKTYPIAYNKWIKYQVAEILNMPGLYQKLVSVFSIQDIESDEMNVKAKMLYDLIDKL